MTPRRASTRLPRDGAGRQADAEALAAGPPRGNKAPEGGDPAMTARQRAVMGLDLTAPGDIQRLRDLLAPEYDTLRAHRDELLAKANGQYVLIHGREVQVHATLDIAMQSGDTRYSEDLFFVGRIDERELSEYLAV